MSKPFITYTAQIEKLKNEKNLVITDDDFAVESLQNISYYALIGGYKHPFIDIHTLDRNQLAGFFRNVDRLHTLAAAVGNAVFVQIGTLAVTVLAEYQHATI